MTFTSRMSTSLTIRYMSGRSTWCYSAVKLWIPRRQANTRRPLGPESRVITLRMVLIVLNALCLILGEEAVIAGHHHVVLMIAKPGVIHHTGHDCRIHCGRLDRRPDAYTRR